ncbi:hypothetical protein CHS0354_013309 [Potamilus streckersoni]|uniref:Uncharacterized protein n=1 Tax=Potamilus streckersoni TaxID=2493646 RepID=A0AAE0SAQ7_9BIVA|nr:hypothetical protein CHS0354_013309 [Potamilus streckersoni]
MSMPTGFKHHINRCNNVLLSKRGTYFGNHSESIRDIVHPIDLHTTNGFSATWSSDGTLKLTFMLGLLNCSHKGAYNISVTMNGTSTVHDVYLHVIDHPQIPVIAVESDGIIENQGGEISCRAMTGCSNAQFEFVLSGSGNDIWDIWRETNQPSSRLTYLGWETQFVTTISRDKVTNVDKRKFRCSYMTNRKIYISPALCIGIIPADFCQKDVGLCNYRHPYLCNKFVSCASATNPLERLCHQPNQPETHFVGSGGCHSSCDWPAKANCTLKNYCD